MHTQEPKIVIFDGVCNLCNGAVNFIIRRDPTGKFSFVPLQSHTARVMTEALQISGLSNDTFILVEGNSYRVRTDAALAIAAELEWPWPLSGAGFKVFRLIPAGFRDYLYDLLGRNRYRLFGRRATCMVPAADVTSRFIQDL